MDIRPDKKHCHAQQETVYRNYPFFSYICSRTVRDTVPREARAKLKAEIDSILQSQVDRDKIPGAVVLIKKDNKVIYRHAYGYAQKV